MKTNTFKVFKLSVARQLIDRGYRVVEVIPNKDKPWFNVYCFEYSDELKELVKQITKH